jgi:hypothetical protein
MMPGGEMGRGGKRDGTGPKPILGEDAFLCRIAIGFEFERRWRNLAIWQARVRERSSIPGSGLEEDLATLNGVHPLMVRKIDGKPVRQIIADLAQTPDGQWPGATSDIIVDGAHAIRDRIKNLAAGHRSRGTFSPPVRPQGFRDRLMAKVAAWATRKYGERITPRFVRGCVEDYRRISKH